MNLTELRLNNIDFVLLDMDGTLLDKYFDDYFWEHLVPERYSAKHNIEFSKAKKELIKKYKIHEKTLNWTDLDFWSEELHLDIPALKKQIEHLINVHPHVEDFLKLLKQKKKSVYLVTNAHYKSINLKLKKTMIGKYFDSVLSSFDTGYPKETIDFWHEAEKRLGFDKRRTLFIDDTHDNLITARQFGIKYILFKGRSNSKIHPEKSKEFLYITDFDELIDAFLNC